MISIFCLMARFPDSSGVGNGPTKCADLAEANIVEQNDNNIGHTLGRRRDPGSFGRIFGRGATGSYCRIGRHRAWLAGPEPVRPVVAPTAIRHACVHV